MRPGAPGAGCSVLVNIGWLSVLVANSAAFCRSVGNISWLVGWLSVLVGCCILLFVGWQYQALPSPLPHSYQLSGWASMLPFLVVDFFGLHFFGFLSGVSLNVTFLVVNFFWSTLLSSFSDMLNQTLVHIKKGCLAMSKPLTILFRVLLLCR